MTSPNRNQGESLDVDAAQARCDAATPGPWSIEPPDSAFEMSDVPVRDAHGEYICSSPDDGVRGGHDVADAEFIAHARADLPAALAEVRVLRARVAAALKLHRPMRVQVGSKTHGGGPEYGDVCARCRVLYPCPDAAALAGES